MSIGYSDRYWGKEPDKKEENSFAAAYGVEINDEGYTALAQQLNAGQVEESTAQPVIAEQVESAKEEPMVYTKKTGTFPLGSSHKL
jgi:hypothetical protein